MAHFIAVAIVVIQLLFPGFIQTPGHKASTFPTKPFVLFNRDNHPEKDLVILQIPDRDEEQ